MRPSGLCRACFPGSRLPYRAAGLKPLSEAAIRGGLGTQPPIPRCLGCALGIDRVHVLLQRLGLRLAHDVELKRSLAFNLAPAAVVADHITQSHGTNEDHFGCDHAVPPAARLVGRTVSGDAQGVVVEAAPLPDISKVVVDSALWPVVVVFVLWIWAFSVRFPH